MDIKLLSAEYEVRKISESDLPAVLTLCEGNPQYYRYCPPAVNMEEVRAELMQRTGIIIGIYP